MSETTWQFSSVFNELILREWSRFVIRSCLRLRDWSRFVTRSRRLLRDWSRLWSCLKYLQDELQVLPWDLNESPLRTRFWWLNESLLNASSNLNFASQLSPFCLSSSNDFLSVEKLYVETPLEYEIRNILCNASSLRLTLSRIIIPSIVTIDNFLIVNQIVIEILLMFFFLKNVLSSGHDASKFWQCFEILKQYHEWQWHLLGKGLSADDLSIALTMTSSSTQEHLKLTMTSSITFLVI